MKKKENNQSNEVTSNKELCVVCWKETEFDKDTPIELRERYVHGVANYVMNVGKNSMATEINKTTYNL